MSKEQEWIKRASTFYAGLVADNCDKVGYRNQILPAKFRPLDPSTVVVGFAYTVQCEIVDVVPADAEEFYKTQFEAVDNVTPDSVAVVAGGEHPTGAFWGELMSTRVRACGGRGVVIEGTTRDVQMVKEMDFPCFITGINPGDSAGRVNSIAYQIPIEIGGVKIYPGDFVFGDVDGVVIIPKAVIEEVITLAEEKRSKENLARDALRAGMSVKEMYKKYHVI